MDTLFQYTFDKEIELLPKGPLKDGRFQFSTFKNVFFQIVANKDNPKWQRLTDTTMKRISYEFRSGAINPRFSVLYADIFSLDFDARGDRPIGYLALDNNPPPGWDPNNDRMAVA